ncbi:MAG: hypothetical protein L0Z50_33645 [Verrucomicrobiales bacterium]|nr:hypothetical protein [Verrucomicrobiales bacterium]
MTKVYAIYDPRGNPSVPVYAGKGSGNRARAHNARLRAGEGEKLPYKILDVESLDAEVQWTKLYRRTKDGGTLYNDTTNPTPPMKEGN